MLATWFSYRDLVSLMTRCVQTEQVGYAVIWGASDNARSFWRRDDRERLGWSPKETADSYAPQLQDAVSGDPITERYQGGAYCANLYSKA